MAGPRLPVTSGRRPLLINRWHAVTPTAADDYSAADICMTPSGQVFYRPSSAPTEPFRRMSGNHEFRVWMEIDSEIVGVERSVFVLPNGTARVAL